MSTWHGVLVAGMSVALATAGVVAQERVISADDEARVVEQLVAVHGEAHTVRIGRGVRQTAERWWGEDGSAEAFLEFCLDHFIPDETGLQDAFSRLQEVLEQVDGHLHEVHRELHRPLDLDLGPVSPLDRALADVDLAAHVDENLFRTRVAFIALLNFPVHSLQERLEFGAEWNREQWARSRMMDRFSERIPAAVIQTISRILNEADQYVAGYNIRLDRVVNEKDQVLFPEGLRLISHWGLRDEIASLYAEPDGLPRQSVIQRIMERIVRQDIPAVVIDNPDYLWNPFSNEVTSAGTQGSAAEDAVREADVRYARLLDVFHAIRKADPFTPATPSHIARAFERGRQIPEEQFEELLVAVVGADEVKLVGDLVRERLGRPLEPFDIWYPGFEPRGEVREEELDRIVAERYPDVAAFERDLPRLLNALGFSRERAAWLARRIAVDAARGAGHAMGAERRGDRAHLRTRVPEDGMDYKGYNIAMHELGHNVEQVFSLDGIDHWWLKGVPNNAFTEAFAFIFQARDLEMLGLPGAGEQQRALEALATLWSTFEIAGVSLVDMRAWRWLYDNPDAGPAETREAVLAIARDVWNQYFAPVFGDRDSELLAIYSHMISYPLYLPDYPLGKIIAFQVGERVHSDDFGKEVERMTRLGRLTPDAWMREAVGAPLSAAPLLREVRSALATLGEFPEQ